MKSIIVALATSTLLATSAVAYAQEMPEHVMLGAGETLAKDQTFTIWALDNLSAVDPGLSEGSDAFDTIRNQFEGLFSQGPSGELRPGVALEYMVSEDKKTYTFNLRRNAKWSDHQAVTAHDFVYAWRRVVDPETASPYSYYFEMMQVKGAADVINGFAKPEKLGVKAVDDFTLQVELESALPYFPIMLTHGTTYPVPQWTIETHGDKWTLPENIVVNGPFKLTENNLGESYVMERNPLYWDDPNTILDKIEFLIIPDENQAFTRYLAGELDQTRTPTGQFPRLLKQYPDQVYSAPNLCTYYANFNLREDGPEAFQDWRVRKALWLAVDRDILVDKILQEGQRPAYAFTHDLTAGYTAPHLQESEWTQEKRDQKARELMLEAGYGPDNRLSFDYVYNTSESHKKVAIFLQQQWKTKLAVDMTISSMEWKTLLETRSLGDFEMSRNAWCGDYNEPSTFVDLYHTNSTQNDSKYSNTQVDNLLELSKTSDDPQPLYTMIEGFVQEEAGIIPIYHYTSPFIMKPTVKGWPYENVMQRWQGKDLYIVDEN